MAGVGLQVNPGALRLQRERERTIQWTDTRERRSAVLKQGKVRSAGAMQAAPKSHCPHLGNADVPLSSSHSALSGSREPSDTADRPVVRGLYRR